MVSHLNSKALYYNDIKIYYKIISLSMMTVKL